MPAADSRSVQTLADLADLIATRGDAEVMRYKRDGAWHSLAGREVYRRIARVALALARLGVKPGDRVALLSENRPEWTIADLAILSCGAINVPLYPTLTADSCEFILKDSGARAVFVSNPEHLRKICSVWPNLPDLEFAALIDGSPESGQAGGRIRPWAELCAEGDCTAEELGEFQRLHGAVQPGDVSSFVYTSGTTGTPKGVMLTHRNIVSNMLATPPGIVETGDLALSFLPLSHVYERMVDFVFLQRGVCIAYAESIEAVAQNLLEVRPTVAAAVPRFFEKLYVRVLQSLQEATWARRKLFWWAMSIGRRALQCHIDERPVPALLRVERRLAERLVFQRLRDRLGGRIRCFMSGGAPLAAELAFFFNAAGLIICEGYGLTEASPVVACTTPSRVRPGTVGRPLEGVEVRLAGDGEILARGPNIMMGYYNQPEETARVLRDGWLHTGDVGEFTAQGDLRITDRKKDLLKTAGGKFVAPQPIENMLRASGYVLNAVVIGDRRPYVAALIVPNLDRLAGLAGADSPAERVRHPQVLAFMQRLVDQVNTRLAPFEQVKRFALLDHDFTVETGELTPTMKVRRTLVETQYRDVVDSLFPRV